MISTPAPWHHWPIAILAVIFFLIGAIDTTLTLSGMEFYIWRFTPKQLAFVSDMATWVKWVWAVSVWGGLLGAILLWRRSRSSVILLFAAFALLTLAVVWTTIFSRPSLSGAMGFSALYMLVGTCALAFVFYAYARWERERGKL